MGIRDSSRRGSTRQDESAQLLSKLQNWTSRFNNTGASGGRAGRKAVECMRGSTFRALPRDKRPIHTLRHHSFWTSLIALRTAPATSTAPGKSPWTQIDTFVVPSGKLSSFAPDLDVHVPVSIMRRACVRKGV